MRWIIIALIALFLVSGCVETQSDPEVESYVSDLKEEAEESQQQEEIPEVDLELVELSCDNTEGDINVPNDYGANCSGIIANHGYKLARHVKISFKFYDDGGLVGSTSTQPISNGGEVPSNQTRPFRMEIEIKRPYTMYTKEVTYPEEFVS